MTGRRPGLLWLPHLLPKYNRGPAAPGKQRGGGGAGAEEAPRRKGRCRGRALAAAGRGGAPGGRRAASSRPCAPPWNPPGLPGPRSAGGRPAARGLQGGSGLQEEERAPGGAQVEAWAESSPLGTWKGRCRWPRWVNEADTPGVTVTGLARLWSQPAQTPASGWGALHFLSTYWVPDTAALPESSQHPQCAGEENEALGPRAHTGSHGKARFTQGAVSTSAHPPGLSPGREAPGHAQAKPSPRPWLCPRRALCPEHQGASG